MGVDHGANNPISEKYIVTKLKDRNSRTDVFDERHMQGNGHRKRKNDIYFATWNVRTLNKPGALHGLKQEMEKYRIGVAAVQEVRWKGNGIIRSGNYTIMYSGGDNGRLGGTGFLVDNKYKAAVINFNPVNERMCTLRMKAHFFNITLVCVYAPTEDEEDEVKDEFYAQLEQELEGIPRNDVKIVIGDFNAKVGKEETFRETVGKESLHEVSNKNGQRLIDFARGNAMVVMSTWLQRKNIRKATWRSPDGTTFNQIDHVVIDGRHASDILEVDSCRGADCDSDHYMVRVKYRQRIAVYRSRGKRKAPRRYNVSKLKEQEVLEKYQTELQKKCEAKQNQALESIKGKWSMIKEALQETAEEVLGFEERVERAGWYDGECKKAVEERNEARKKMINRTTRSNTEEFIKKRKEADRICRRKKREFERKWIMDLEKEYNDQEVRKFYKRVQEMKKGFQPRTVFCRDKEGNFIGGEEQVLDRWAEYFSELLNVTTGREDLDENETEGDQPWQNSSQEERPVPTPTMEEVRKAIKSLRNNKAPGNDNITAEMIKGGGEHLIRLVHQLIVEIWEKEEMPDQWNMAIICPIHKKKDKTNCENYRGIALVSVVYKVLAKVIAMRLAPITEQILGDYQCGFRRGRSTTDQIFILRQIMEKCYEYNVDVHQLFVDFKQAYDSVKRKKLYQTLMEMEFPSKLIRLVQMTLTNTKCQVKIEGKLSKEFEVNQGLRQGDVLSTLLFNIVLERVMRRVEIDNPGGTLFNRMNQNLAYADDVCMLSRSLKDLEEGFDRLEKEAEQLGLRVNNTKTQYLFASRKNVVKEKYIKLNGGNYERCEKFQYLGVLVTEDSRIREEIKSRIAAGNRAYWAMIKILQSRSLSRKSKVTVYRTVIRPVVMYGSETWTMTVAEEELLRRWERKILRKIFGAVNEDGQWRIRRNKELEELYRNADLVTEIKCNRLRWLGHVERMSEDRAVKKVYRGNPGGKRCKGRPRKRWLEDVENDLRKMGVRRWRKRAEERQDWAVIIREAKALHGL